MKTDVKNLEYIDKNGNKLLFISFFVMFFLSVIPFLPLKLLGFFNEGLQIVISLAVFLTGYCNLLLLPLVTIITIIVLAHNLIPNKTIKNYVVITFCIIAILFYITMFSLFLDVLFG